MESERQRLTRIKTNLQLRGQIYRLTRDFFNQHDFIEVETPLRTRAPAPERYIVPFESDGWFLSTSPELYMKRLLAAGYEKIFQISHCFRKVSRAESTILNLVSSNGTAMVEIIFDMIRDTEDLVITIATYLNNNPVLRYRGNEIDLALPWKKITVKDAFLGATGSEPPEDSCQVDIDLVDKVVPGFASDHPTVLIDYPVAMASLARLKPGTWGSLRELRYSLAGWR